MSYDTERYSFEKMSGQSLSVIQCGLTICHSGHSSIKMVYPCYSATFIIEGKGTYYMKGKSYELGAGQGFIIVPNIPNVYIADVDEPWKYIYVCFNGADAKTLLGSCGLDDDNVIFEFPTDGETINCLEKAYHAGKDKSAKGYDALGYFLIVMSNLVRADSKNRKQALSATHYIRAAISYIADHLTYDVSVNDVAAFVGIDRTYLYRLFTEELGISPSKYIIDERLKRSVELMEYDELSINEIAVSAGFYDLSHFTKCFVEKYGVTPGKYRKSKVEE